MIYVVKSMKKIKINQSTSELWYAVCKNVILTLVHLLVLSCDLFIEAGPWINTGWLNWRWWASDWLLHSFPGTDRLSKYYAIRTVTIRHISYSLVTFIRQFESTVSRKYCHSPSRDSDSFTSCHVLTSFWRVRKIEKATISFKSVRPSARPCGTTGLPLVGFSWNLIFEYFSTFCGENSSFIEIGQE